MDFFIYKIICNFLKIEMYRDIGLSSKDKKIKKMFVYFKS